MIFHVQVGYGKGTPSKVLWVDCIDPSLSEQQLEKHFAKQGRVARFGFDQFSGTAMVQYDTIEDAKEALGRIKGTTIGNSRMRVMVRLLRYQNRKECNACFVFHLG